MRSATESTTESNCTAELSRSRTRRRRCAAPRPALRAPGPIPCVLARAHPARSVGIARISSKAAWTIDSNLIAADGDGAAAGSLSIATTTKVWPLLLVAR
jgi:hypothetical protein